MPKEYEEVLNQVSGLKPFDIPFNRPKLIGNERSYIQQGLEEGFFAGNGRFTVACESLLKEMTGSPKVQLVHSCTAALEMAAILCDLGPGDEVITPSFTFVSTANAVVMRGATPVFVDILPNTLNIDPDAVAKAVTPKTKAIFAVHYAGVPAEMDALAEIAKAHNIILVEDAAQALGSKYNGRPAGSLGDLAAFSFHATKNVTSGEGGALAINRADLVERADVIRDKGTNRSQFFDGLAEKYTWVDIGSSYSPSELTAAMLLAQLEQMEAVISDRLSSAARYQSAFTDLAEMGRIDLLVRPVHCQGNGHLFCLLLRDEAERRKFIADMDNFGIGTPFHYVPLHSSPAGRKYGKCSGSLTVTEQLAERLVRLPLYYNMGETVDRVIKTARNALMN
ncbi:dTDP-4-amino-4,6-dideoxygalactose transaminase [Ruegeria arenilitoris]|uniref:dTDP-4-amino-4,6-dideoxygalactose transaminase n=1 Tax=Ruegeria arenilitoris TaxID=1173585 RepID=UPI00147DBAA2|nr:dTDP-4-amino-4,6-dideoxygalactose transaminase [Ruegeria arenilitoris]